MKLSHLFDDKYVKENEVIVNNFLSLLSDNDLTFIRLELINYMKNVNINHLSSIIDLIIKNNTYLSFFELTPDRINILNTLLVRDIALRIFRKLGLGMKNTELELLKLIEGNNDNTVTELIDEWI